MNKIQSRLLKAMEVRGMTAADLCRKSGIAKSLISRYIHGTVEPKQSNIYELAVALNVSPAWLMGFNVTMDGNEVLIDVDKLSDVNKEKLKAYYQALIDSQE